MASTMATAPVVIPTEILDAIGKDDAAIRLELAIFFYKEFQLSAGEAANFAGISRVAFWRELGERRISIQYDESAAKHDVETMEQFNREFPLPNA